MPIETLASLALDAGRDISVLEMRSDSLENPRTSFDRAFELLGGGQLADSGEMVSPTTAMTIGAVFQCVSIIANGTAMLDLLTYRRTGVRIEQDQSHYLYRLLRDDVRPHMTAFRWKRLMQSWVLLHGNAYSIMTISRNGLVTQLDPIHPDRVRLVEGGYTVQVAQGNPVFIPEALMLHIRGIETDERGLGLSIVGQARQAIGMAMATDRFGARYFGNGSVAGGFIEIAENLSTEARKNMLKVLEARHGGAANAHRIGILDGGSKFIQTTIPPDDAQFLQTRKFNVNEICRWFGVPPHMVGELERSTNNNIEHQGLEFVTHCLGPHLENFESECNSALLSEMESKTVFVQFRREKLIQGDMASRATVAATLRSNGIITGNESRAPFGYNPHPDGDTLLANGTFTPVSVLNQKTSAPAADPNEGSEPSEPAQPAPVAPKTPSDPSLTDPEIDPEDAPE
jgi:HK97 family phage portal protein